MPLSKLPCGEVASARHEGLDRTSAVAEKVGLFRALFRGREEVYARRFTSTKTGRAGYQPVCGNEWMQGVCEKPRIRCSECSCQRFLPVSDHVLRWHLSGAVLIMIILGGLGHLRGALIGAFAFALLQELFKSEAIFGSFAKHWHLGLGLSIIASVVLLPRGLVGLPEQIRARLLGAKQPGGTGL